MSAPTIPVLFRGAFRRPSGVWFSVCRRHCVLPIVFSWWERRL